MYYYPRIVIVHAVAHAEVKSDGSNFDTEGWFIFLSPLGRHLRGKNLWRMKALTTTFLMHTSRDVTIWFSRPYTPSYIPRNNKKWDLPLISRHHQEHMMSAFEWYLAWAITPGPTLNKNKNGVLAWQVLRMTRTRVIIEEYTGYHSLIHLSALEYTAQKFRVQMAQYLAV